MIKNFFDLTGQTAVVIGGTSVLGKAIAIGLAEAGADVVATSRSIDSVNAVCLQISQIGRKTLACAIDANRRDQVRQLANRVREEIGPASILVNAAGKTLKKPSAELTDDDWEDLMSTNLGAVLKTCQAFLPQLEETKGCVLNLASLTSFVAFHEVSAYNASKGAVMMLTKSLACEWAKAGIRVNALVPGVFPTPLNSKLLTGTPRGEEILTRTPMGRFGAPEEIVGAAIFLCSPCASFVTGHGLAVDGGYLASGVNC